MSFTLISTDQSFTGSYNDAYDMLANEDYFVTQGTLITHDGVGSEVFQADGEDNTSVIIEGQVIADFRGWFATSCDNAQVIVGQTGSVTGYGAGLHTNSVTNASIINYGSVTSVAGSAVYMSGSGSFQNYGTMTGNSGVILRSSGTGIDGINGGSIVASGTPSGSWNEFGNGVQLFASNTTFVNLAGGLIASHVEERDGVQIGAYVNIDNTTLINYGDIVSTKHYGVDIWIEPDDNDDVRWSVNATVKNFGTITGETGSLRDLDQGNVVMNAGLMVGDVFMNGGDDVFRTKFDGRVEGVVDGGAGNDMLVGGKHEDIMTGGADNDKLQGRGGDDTLNGGDGIDTVSGGDGNDALYGGNQDDVIRGGAGDDAITGGKGTDKMSGGAGADTFIFTAINESKTGSNRDVITDFDTSEDMIDLSGIAGGPAWRGLGSFTSGGNAEVKIVENNAGQTIVVVDVNGDGTADMQVQLNAVTGLTEDNFIL